MRKIAIAVIASLALPVSAANADGIRSPLGISQAEWNASPAYQNFQCPAGTSRGEGVDMNFTTNRSDDYYFVECNPIQVYVAPTPTSPTPIASSDTATTTTPAPQPVGQSTPTPAPSPVITDTSTASTAPSTTTPVITPTSILDEELDLTWDWDKVFAWIVAWFDKWWKL
jgi:hypothetical protein